MMNKKLLLITLLALPMVTFGEWTHIGESTMHTKFYTDFDRIRTADNYIYYWALIDRPEGSKEELLSSIHYFELDCVLLKQRSLEARGYDGHMTEGESFGYSQPAEWRYPPPDSPAEVLAKIICEYAKENL